MFEVELTVHSSNRVNLIQTWTRKPNMDMRASADSPLASADRKKRNAFGFEESYQSLPFGRVRRYGNVHCIGVDKPEAVVDCVLSHSVTNLGAFQVFEQFRRSVYVKNTKPIILDDYDRPYMVSLVSSSFCFCKCEECYDYQ